MDGLSDDQLVDLMVAARRTASRAQAAELAAVAALAERRHVEAADPEPVEAISPVHYLHDEVADALTLTRNAAGDLIEFATGLKDRLPGTLTALRTGDIDFCKARTIWLGIRLLDDELAARVEDKVLPRAPGQTTGEIRAKIRRLVRDLDPEALDRRRKKAEAARRVELMDDDDGTAWLVGCDLPADQAGAAFNRLTAIAKGLRADGDERGLAQLRADLFLDTLCGRSTAGGPPVVPVTQDFDAAADAIAHALAGTVPTARAGDDSGKARLAGLITRAIRDAQAWTAPDDLIADAVAIAARNELAAFTGELADRHRGLAALIAQAGERIAVSLTDLKANWCVTGQHPDAPDRHGRSGYRPSAVLRRIIEQRDRRCVHPGCRRPVRHCDADHTIPYHRGGRTCSCNVAMLCRHHHRLKQTRGWKLIHLWPGVLLWVTPTGHWHISAPGDRE